MPNLLILPTMRIKERMKGALKEFNGPPWVHFKLDEDGVEEFINGEKINNRDIVIWYVPRVQNDSREGQEYCWADTRLENGNLVVKEFPCIVGAKFVPIKSYK